MQYLTPICRWKCVQLCQISSAQQSGQPRRAPHASFQSPATASHIRLSTHIFAQTLITHAFNLICVPFAPQICLPRGHSRGLLRPSCPARAPPPLRSSLPRPPRAARATTRSPRSSTPRTVPPQRPSSTCTHKHLHHGRDIAPTLQLVNSRDLSIFFFSLSAVPFPLRPADSLPRPSRAPARPWHRGLCLCARSARL